MNSSNPQTDPDPKSWEPLELMRFQGQNIVSAGHRDCSLLSANESSSSGPRSVGCDRLGFSTLDGIEEAFDKGKANLFFSSTSEIIFRSPHSLAVYQDNSSPPTAAERLS
ncbi:hypothetical protein EVAR_19069_1 [Eumeta japonica]|uniref:Uncharacterized protein n=1 Tax=Eumeta variegata TaxID=151549 RepID=A0A4C1UP26_EUMVA|nr:hypothetical protein EVAR_19069_1 [Eumeta japonica]